MCVCGRCVCGVLWCVYNGELIMLDSLGKYFNSDVCHFACNRGCSSKRVH